MSSLGRATCLPSGMRQLEPCSRPFHVLLLSTEEVVAFIVCTLGVVAIWIGSFAQVGHGYASVDAWIAPDDSAEQRNVGLSEDVAIELQFPTRAHASGVHLAAARQREAVNVAAEHCAQKQCGRGAPPRSVNVRLLSCCRNALSTMHVCA